MQRVIVIGGTSGIGQAIIDRFLQPSDQEAHVLFTYNNGESTAKLLRERHGERCSSYRLDLSSLDTVQAFLAELKPSAPPSVLVNCAGMVQDGLVMGDIKERLALVTAVNYLAPAMIAAHVAKLMAAERRGHIVNITSVAARRPGAGNAVYGSSKAALERFTASLALEVARFKVRTLCVAPGFVDTPMFRTFAKDGPEQFIRSSIPMREVLKPQDVASAVVGFVRGAIMTTGTTLTLANGELVF